ncbi:MAG: ABC transporter ATP-binding protein [Actinobacteria bacterium]|nr:ABC transporter ATP-binding protein [Actinomycetota bacterium]
MDLGATEIVALLGPSGCGKSTLLRLVAGLEVPDAGTIVVGSALVFGEHEGRSVNVAPERRGVGLVFQNGALFPHLNVADNIAYGLGRTADRELRRARTDELLEMVALSGYGERMPDELSGGQQQRVALARALAPRPAVLLLDEPFSNLDARLRRTLRSEVVEVLREAQTPAIVVTHDRDEAFAMADRVAVMRDGRIAQTGSPVELYERPADDWIARFVGDANVLEVSVGGVTQVGTALGKLQVSEPTDAGALVLVRPEHVSFERATTWPLGVVVGVEFTGATAIVDVDADGVRLRAEQPWRTADRLAVGDSVVARLTDRFVAHPLTRFAPANSTRFATGFGPQGGQNR